MNEELAKKCAEAAFPHDVNILNREQCVAAILSYTEQAEGQRDDLLKVLQRWEGAVNEVEGQGNDSEEAVKELNDSRAALLALLHRALPAPPKEKA